MTWLGRWIGPCSLSAILGLAGCGPPFTTATGGTGGTGGAGSGAGSSTSSGTTTTTTTTTVCTPGVVGTCGVGLYCDSSSTCTSCNLATGLSFGTPQMIPLGQGPVPATFPREDKATGNLLFVDPANQIEQAMGGTQGMWMAAMDLPAPYNTMPQSMQEGPLSWTDGTSIEGIVDVTAVKTSEPILLFGSQRTGDQMLYAANLEMPPPTSAVLLKMPPFESGDRSIAVAFNGTPTRAFWLRGGHLWTTPTGAGAALLATQLTIAFDGGCTPDPSGAISNPWVRPDGKLLLFSAPPYSGAGCTLPMMGAQARLFYVNLDAATGQPTGPATQIFGGDTVDDDLTPSLSDDGCLLLLSRSGILTEALRE